MRLLARCLLAILTLSIGWCPALADPGGWLGIGWHFWTEEEIAEAKGKPRGFKIARVFEGSPAADAGLVRDDIIVGVDGREYTNLKEMMDYVFAAGPEAVVKLEVIRNGAEQIISSRLVAHDVGISILKKSAAAGDSFAMLYLGSQFHMGRGVPNDYKEARRWYLMAAEKGETRAMITLGDLDQQGKGGKLDAEAARRWYQRAADAGDPEGSGRLKYYAATRSERLRELLNRGVVSPAQDTRWPPGLAAALGEQLRACWKPVKEWPAVTVRFKLTQDGTLSGEPEVPLRKVEARDAETAAVGAIAKCQPFRLPAEHYEAWKSVVWTFDPSIISTGPN